MMRVCPGSPVDVVSAMSGVPGVTGVCVVPAVANVTGVSSMTRVANGMGQATHRHRQQASGARDERDQVEIHA